MPVHPITAVDLAVRDLDRSLDFYTALLGLPLAQPAGGGRAVVDAGPIALRLREEPDAADSGWLPDDLQRGFRHLGFRVGDIDERAAALRAAGVEFRLAPTDVHSGVRIAFFSDPDGVQLEFVQGQSVYDEVGDPALVEAERARPFPVTPRLDHVAVTAADLAATTGLYRDALGFGVAGRLLLADDPRGFAITFLHAGATAVEVFTFAVPRQESAWRAEPGRAGLRAVVFAGGGAELTRRLTAAGARPAGDDRLVVDPDGLPLRGESG